VGAIAGQCDLALLREAICIGIARTSRTIIDEIGMSCCGIAASRH
jgi:hypothetical protein